MFHRIIWIILDSVGAGELPDSDQYHDTGADTLGHIFQKLPGFDLPNLRKLGLGNIDGLDKIPEESRPVGIYGKAKEVSVGKDTTVGHFEMTGIYTEKMFPTYPDGFPQEIIDKFIKWSNLPGILCNKTGSGTEILEQYGAEHLKTRKPIIYTSVDSVFQIACHEEIYSHCVARVIARPFVGTEGHFTRTANRRDFSVMPEDGNLLDLLEKKNIKVYAVGKIADIFCKKGIYKSVHTRNNMDGIARTLQFMKEIPEGLIFTNLVDFDTVWGHRRDLHGYGTGLQQFDQKLPEIIAAMNKDDLLIINADHGCDPVFRGTDHTREYVPVLMYGAQTQKNVNLHILNSFADIGQTIADNFGIQIKHGTSQLDKITL